MTLHFEPIWSWPLMLVALAVLLSVFVAGYPRRIRHLSAGTQRTLLALRAVSVLLLCLLMLRPVMMSKRDDKSDAILYILTDASRSMETTDTPGGSTRRIAATGTLSAAEESLTKLRERVEIRFRDFDETLTTIDAPSPEAKGRMTAIGHILEQLGEEAGRTKVAGVVLLGDGKQAATGSLDVDPLRSARLLGRQQRPIYSVLYGSSESSEAGLDLSLDELDVARDVFAGNALPIRVKLKSLGALGQNVSVRVLLEDRTNVGMSVSGELKEVPPAPNSQPVVAYQPKGADDTTTVQLQIVPNAAGDIKLAVEVVPLPGEVRRTNNRVETIIRVRQGGIRVAYFDILRPEQKWLREINRSSRVQLDFQLVRSGKFADRNDIRDEFFERGRYDAYIIGNVPASAFQPRQLAAISERCVQGVGLMMMGGFENYGAGGYDKTPLARLMPVEMGPGDQQLKEPLRMVPTTAGLSHFVMQIAPVNQVRERWNLLPPLSGGNLLRQKQISGAQVLATSADGVPLLIGQSIGVSRVLAFAGDTTWQWAMKGYAEEHQRFWRQVIFWLTKKELDNESPVWVSVEPRDVIPGQPAEIQFGSRGPEGQPILSDQYTAELTTPAGEVRPLLARRTAEGAAADFTDTSEPGDYWVRVRATRNGEFVENGLAVTRFTVNTRDPEVDYPAADPGLMREMAHLSGGEFLTADDLLKRLESWADDGLPGLDLERTERQNLWDNWFMLGLLVLFLTAEWALRKKRGLV